MRRRATFGHARSHRALAPAWLVAALGLSVGCECGSERHAASSAAAPPAPALPAVAPQPAHPLSGPLLAGGDAAAPAPARALEPRRAARVLAADVGGREASSPLGGVSGRFVLDTLVDIAAAGPATATEQGVAMVNRDNQLWLAPLAAPLRPGAKPRPTPLRVLPEGAGPFPLAKGPAVRGGVAYWVSRGRLLRRALAAANSAGIPDVLREDARVGTRVAVPLGATSELAALPPLAAYVARSTGADAPLTAKLWVEGQAEPLSLSDDITSTHSVALVAAGSGLAAIFLEARTGMSSLHLRTLALSADHQLGLGEDHIVWVGGPSRSSTEFVVQSSDGESVFGLMALERDITHFGLLLLQLPLSGTTEAPDPDWLLYQNGIEPAPMASARLCGRQVVVLARPSSPQPNAPQELVLLDLERLDAPGIVLARSSAFFDVSLSEQGGGALLAYVADQRTWGRSVRCSPG